MNHIVYMATLWSAQWEGFGGGAKPARCPALQECLLLLPTVQPAGILCGKNLFCQATGEGATSCLPVLKMTMVGKRAARGTARWGTWGYEFSAKLRSLRKSTMLVKGTLLCRLSPQWINTLKDVTESMQHKCCQQIFWLSIKSLIKMQSQETYTIIRIKGFQPVGMQPNSCWVSHVYA